MNKAHLGFALSTIASIGFSYPQIASQNQQIQIQREEISQAQLAESRYERGCTLTVAMSSPKDLVSIQTGEPVMDRTTKKPLPNGTVVCDFNGNTAVIKGGVASNLAFTGNRELAYQQLKKVRGAKVFYYVPGK